MAQVVRTKHGTLKARFKQTHANYLCPMNRKLRAAKIFTTSTHARRSGFSPSITELPAKKHLFRSEHFEFELSCIKFKPFRVFRAEFNHMSLSIADRESNLHFAEYLNLQGKAKKSVGAVSRLRAHVSLSC